MHACPPSLCRRSVGGAWAQPGHVFRCRGAAVGQPERAAELRTQQSELRPFLRCALLARLLCFAFPVCLLFVGALSTLLVGLDLLCAAVAGAVRLQCLLICWVSLRPTRSMLAARLRLGDQSTSALLTDDASHHAFLPTTGPHTPAAAAAASKDLAEFTFKMRKPGTPEWEGVDTSLDVTLRYGERQQGQQTRGEGRSTGIPLARGEGRYPADPLLPSHWPLPLCADLPWAGTLTIDPTFPSNPVTL